MATERVYFFPFLYFLNGFLLACYGKSILFSRELGTIATQNWLCLNSLHFHSNFQLANASNESIPSLSNSVYQRLAVAKMKYKSKEYKDYE